ncbi:MAG: GNAT family N-acetyltransferase [Candidatus Yanofskybacteria bacterium]|nr:GNAT family N-acetyltransferase [Candidatus Yanofskybacteria bacterium]
MIIRDFKKDDLEAVEEIFALYWTDPEFLKKLSLKLKMCIDKTDEYINEKYRFFVAEEKGEVVGIAGFRSAPSHIKLYAKTNNPVEFYILAAKYKGREIGKALRLKRIEEAKKLGFTEAVFYSPNSHKESWGFHDKLDFERVGEVIAPDGEPGQIWRKIL